MMGMSRCGSRPLRANESMRGYSAGWQIHAHHRAAHDMAVGVRFAACKLDQFVDRGAEQDFEILCVGYIAGDGDNAR